MASSRLAPQLARVRSGVKRRLKTRLASTPGGDRRQTAIDEIPLWVLQERYEGEFAVDPISYATVRDHADSIDNLPPLATVTGDMKDVQRCWMVKAILGTVPSGSRLVEIGAGEPLVAAVLARLGYDVTVVDPYDGTGNGPREFSIFTAAYPEVRFVREPFPPPGGLDGEFDAVYSISVLEHVPEWAVAGLVDAGRDLVRARGGVSIHAVDHVIAGWSADEHRVGIEEIAGAMDLDAGELERTLAAMESDPETYLVSAEAHNE